MEDPSTTPVSIHLVGRDYRRQQPTPEPAPEPVSEPASEPTPEPAAEPVPENFPADALAVVPVYRWWTGQGLPPWIPKNQPQQNEWQEVLNYRFRRHRNKRRKRNGDECDTPITNALLSFTNDLRLVVHQALPRSIFYAGATIRIQTDNQLLRAGHEPLRVAAVFWSPSKIVARNHSTNIRGSSENQLKNLLENSLLRQHQINLDLSIVYVMPRWIPTRRTSSSQQSSKFLQTPAASLAWGVWQLGLRLCMLRPHVILTTSTDVARVIACTEGMRVQHIATETSKATLYRLPAPLQEPTSQNLDECVLRHRIERIVINLKDPAAPPRTLQHPPPKPIRGLCPHKLYHLRLPHPFLLTKPVHDEREQKHQQASRAWFLRTMERLVALARRHYDATDTVHVHGDTLTQNPVRARVVMRLSPPPKKRKRIPPPPQLDDDAVEEIDSTSPSSSLSSSDGAETRPPAPKRQCYLVFERVEDTDTV